VRRKIYHDTQRQAVIREEEAAASNMRVHVINLERSADRRTYLCAQLDRLGVDYSVFKAIEPPQAREWFDRYDERQYLRNTGRTASPGEIACFGSHSTLWKKAVATGEPLAVLEDDVEILPTFPQALAETARLIESYGFMRLAEDGPTRHVRTIPMETAGDFTVVRYTRYPFGSMGYAISPRTAAAFLAASAVVAGPPDLFIKKFWEHRQVLYGLSPASVGTNKFGSTPVMQPRVKAKLGPTARIARLASKLAGSVRRARFNASVDHGRRAKLRAVDADGSGLAVR
jgi:glycosyl transferase family 25